MPTGPKFEKGQLVKWKGINATIDAFHGKDIYSITDASGALRFAYEHELEKREDSNALR
jgi:hypothetical protein